MRGSVQAREGGKYPVEGGSRRAESAGWLQMGRIQYGCRVQCGAVLACSCRGLLNGRLPRANPSRESDVHACATVLKGQSTKKLTQEQFQRKS